MSLLEVEDLEAGYGDVIVLRGVSFAVQEGQVAAILGPNGSGKTTTIRMLLGLVRADSGTAELFGEQVPRRLPRVIDRVGAIVESPKFFPAFTARQNLSLLAAAIGSPRTRVDEVLEATRLGDRGRDRYAGFSLGMKQRLAIAATLLKEPSLLILDEPTNGLDPAGIREIRDTIRDLSESGVTVLLSSHILAEVQQVCTSATIIGNGRMLASGTVEDLLRSGTSSYRVGVSDPDAAVRVLGAAGYAVSRSAETLEVETERPGSDVTRALAAQDLWVDSLVPVRQDLESFFLELTAADTLGAPTRGDS
jgi:ABC-type multidrug transport system ATPase subunit